MLTFFSNPRAFKGPFDRIQRNAVQSWKKMCPECQIILFDDEEHTTAHIARELGVEFISDRKISEFGTPMLDDSFQKVQSIARFNVIVQISTDIIITGNDFLASVKKVLALMAGKPFFIAGRRWDLDFEEAIDFSQKDWQVGLIKLAKEKGKLHGFSGMDYWVLPRNLPFTFPPFVIGRPGTDSWLVYKARSIHIPVIDATSSIMIIHQNHPYPRKREDSFIVEKEKNLRLAGGFINLLTLREADWLLTSKGLIKPLFPQRIFSELALFYPWRALVAVKRNIDRLLQKW